MDRAKVFSVSHGVNADDDMLLNLFQIVVLTFAYTAHVKSALKNLLRSRLAFRKDPETMLSVLYSVASFAIAIATFFMLVMPWYFALPIAVRVFFLTAFLRSIFWLVTDRQT